MGLIAHPVISLFLSDSVVDLWPFYRISQNISVIIYCGCMRAAAISTGPDTHLDHLGILAAILDVPLIVTDRKSYELAQLFYPQAKPQFMEHGELGLDFLAANFDLLFSCGKFWCLELQPLFQLLFQKKMRFVFCPHGNSDKGSTLAAGDHPPQDIALVYGEHMHNLLQRTGALSQVGTTITTGNYRYPFYLQHRAFYDTLAQEKIFCRFASDKKTILYAPTWASSENPTAFYKACTQLVQQLGPSYNLLIKPHPFLEEEQPAHLAYLQSSYAHLPHVAFVTGFPAIYPLLAKADIYIGDFSSVGYDFLAFDRPLYFFNPRQKEVKENARPLLYKCGIEIPLHASQDLKKFLDETENTPNSARREIYAHAFGQTRTNLKEEIIKNLIPKDEVLI